MKKWIGFSIPLLCTMMAQATEQPVTCRHPVLPAELRSPPVDLSGKLPVADYLDAAMDCANLRPPGYTPTELRMKPTMAIPGSAWVDEDSRRYSGLLARQKHLWLVVPAQTQYMGFSFAERALISAEIAAAFADQGTLPNLMQVARALGETRRRYSTTPGDVTLSPVDLLTAAVGAQHRVVTYAGHDGQYKMTLTVQLQECATNGRCKVVKQRDWRSLPFTDEMPPFRVVSRLRTEIRRDLLNKGPIAPPATAAGTPNYSGVTPAKLFASAPTATTASFLASLSLDTAEFSRDRMHVLALRGWLDAPPSAESLFYSAYSALALQRRPYALELIKQQKDPANDVLRELLNGNFIDAQRKLPQVKVPLQRLMLSFVVQDLAYEYRRDSQFDTAVAQQVFGDASAQWIPLIVRRANANNYWSRGDAEAIKRMLDALEPIKGLGYSEVRLGSVVAGRDKPMAVVNFRHLNQALDRLGSNATRWQALWLLEGMALSDVISGVYLAVLLQNAPESGRAIVGTFEGILAGHPEFELSRTTLLTELAKRGDADEQRRNNYAYGQAELSAVYWAQGANRASYFTAHRGIHTLAFADAYIRDFPPYPLGPNQLPGVPDASNRSCLLQKYSVSSVEEISFCLHTLKGADAAKLQADVQARFHGNPAATQLAFEPIVSKPGDDPTDGQIAQGRAGIKADPTHWTNYNNVGALLINRRGEYAEAQRVFLSFPRFKGPQTQRVVELSNQAFEAGSQLFWKGQPDLARPLYQIAADLDTGSAASMTSAARLAQLDGDYETAAEIFLERGMRYENSYSYRDYLSLVYAMGHREEADAGFLQVADAFPAPHVWVAALVGQRMAGMTPDQFRAWVTAPDIREARHRGQRFAGYYTMIWATTDRKPDANTVKLIEQVVRGDLRRIDQGDRMVTRQSRTGETDFETMTAPEFRMARTPTLPKPGPVTHEYVLLAQALSALHAGQYQMAHDRFAELANIYSFVRDDTKAAMAYFALAAAKTGDKLGVEKFIDQQGNVEDFDMWLSRAFFAAARKQVDEAEYALKRASFSRPYTEDRPVLVEYQYAEACELVGRETGDPRFVRMMLEWARQNQRIQPTQAWSYAVEAQYSKNPVEANRALALALYLDPLSPRLVGIDEKRRAGARTWLRANNPFLKKPGVSARPVT